MSEVHTAHPGLTAPTLCAAFLQVSETSADNVALRDFGGERTVSYAQWRERAAAVAGGLRALGVGHGDRVALLLSTRLEFHIVDMGALLVGAVPFSLYNTAPVEQLLQPIDNAGPHVLITERSMADKGREIVRRRPELGRLIVVDGGQQGELSLEDLEALCQRTSTSPRARLRCSPVTCAPSSTPRARPERPRASSTATRHGWPR
jgi:long-chain acyl-CoA synthetase